MIERNTGRAMNKALALRNKSRYDRHAVIGGKEAKDVLSLTDDLIRLLDQALEADSTEPD